MLERGDLFIQELCSVWEMLINEHSPFDSQNIRNLAKINNGDKILNSLNYESIKCNLEINVPWYFFFISENLRHITFLLRDTRTITTISISGSQQLVHISILNSLDQHHFSSYYLEGSLSQYSIHSYIIQLAYRY